MGNHWLFLFLSFHFVVGCCICLQLAHQILYRYLIPISPFEYVFFPTQELLSSYFLHRKNNPPVRQTCEHLTEPLGYPMGHKSNNRTINHRNSSLIRHRRWPPKPHGASIFSTYPRPRDRKLGPRSQSLKPSQYGMIWSTWNPQRPSIHQTIFPYMHRVYRHCLCGYISSFTRRE